MSRFDVKSFCSPPDPELICGICMNVLDDPHETLCRHAFCKICITTALGNKRRCPLCRRRCKTYDLRPVLPLVQNLLNKLEMKCPNFRNGQDGISCRQIIKKEYYLDHIKKCDFAYIDCPYPECKVLVLRKDKCLHKQNCEYRLVTCTKGCETQYRWKDRLSHCCIKALKKLVKELVEINKDLLKRVEQQEKGIQGDSYSSTRFAPSHSSRSAGSSHSRRSFSHSRQTLENLPSILSSGTTPSSSSRDQSDLFRHSGSNANCRLLGAWGLLGFGSVSEAEEASGDFQSTLYENYGPPVVDVNEGDVYANYVSVAGLEEAGGNSHERSTDETQRLPSSGQNPIINIAPPVDNPNQIEDFGSEDQEAWEDYDNQYDEDSEVESFEDYPWNDEDEHYSETDEHNEEMNRYDDSETDPGERNSNDGGSNIRSGEVDGEQSENNSNILNRPHGEIIDVTYDNTDEHSRGENPDAEAIQTSGSSCPPSESTPGPSGRQPKRSRDSAIDRQDGAGLSKKSRIDTSAPLEASRNTEAHQESSVDHDRNASEEGDVRRSARLRGVNATPSIIPNVAVPLSTAELLERYADSDEESDDPSWDDDDY